MTISFRLSLLMMLMICSTSGESSFFAIDESLQKWPNGSLRGGPPRVVTSPPSFIRSCTRELLFLAASLSHSLRYLVDRTCAWSSPPTCHHTARMGSLRASPSPCTGLVHPATPDDRSLSFQTHRSLSPS